MMVEVIKLDCRNRDGTGLDGGGSGTGRGKGGC